MAQSIPARALRLQRPVVVCETDPLLLLRLGDRKEDIVLLQVVERAVLESQGLGAFFVLDQGGVDDEARLDAKDRVRLLGSDKSASG